MPSITDNAGLIRERESALQRALLVWIVTGLMFMLLPGALLGVRNLIAISGDQTAAQVDPAWIQAHGHAQIFGWIGTFILGIGFYSLSKMGQVPAFAVSRAWISWSLWTTGVALRWAVNVWQWPSWRWLLPASAVLELAGFLLFFATVSRHRAAPGRGVPERHGRPVWMIVVIAGSVGFLLSLMMNLALTIQSSIVGVSSAAAHGGNQRLLFLFTWAFPVVSIWGFSARWLPVFLGLAAPRDRSLLMALAANTAGVMLAMAAWWIPSGILLLTGAGLAVSALNVFRRPVNAPKTSGVHHTFPWFVRCAYGWLLVAAVLGVSAALWDRSNGLWGSSRHALTVGFMSTMVFAIGQRVLPAFAGMRTLYAPGLMFWSLALLNGGCILRVVSEIGAYESYVPALWPLLGVSALIEIAGFTIFAVNLLLTFRQLPAHLASVQIQTGAPAAG